MTTAVTVNKKQEQMNLV